MEFIHEPYQPGETIAAIATPIGDGGVAIIRISGKEALKVASQVFSGPVFNYPSHTVHFGKILNERKEKIDEVLLLVLKGKKSFTGEDTVEIHCHGGSLITQRVLNTVLKAGARLARPGEFSFKAFINGKIDLTQAEAIQALIQAKSERALDAAEEQLSGKLSSQISSFQKELTNVAAILEAWVDFPEEGLEFISMDNLCQLLESICVKMERLADSFNEGKKLNLGIALCLTGSPNVGKSSLLNALVGQERAIVSSQAGTTRDLIEDQMQLLGLHVRLIDTAGIRLAKDSIEQEGIRRTKEAVKKADLILVVLDAVKGIQEEEWTFFKQLPKNKTIAIWNKMDLIDTPLPPLPFSHIAHISALKKTGLEELISLIKQVIWQAEPLSKEEVVLTNTRHKEALSKAILACKEVLQGLKEDLSPELLAQKMRDVLYELGKILGTNVSEDILSAIFNQFCIGK